MYCYINSRVFQENIAKSTKLLSKATLLNYCTHHKNPIFAIFSVCIRQIYCKCWQQAIIVPKEFIIFHRFLRYDQNTYLPINCAQCVIFNFSGIVDMKGLPLDLDVGNMSWDKCRQVIPKLVLPHCKLRFNIYFFVTQYFSWCTSLLLIISHLCNHPLGHINLLIKGDTFSHKQHEQVLN